MSLLSRVIAALRRKRPRLDDTQPIDIVDAAFHDYQQSVADLLDQNPARRDELRRRLQAATAEWERAEFTAITRPLRRDLRFRSAIRSTIRHARQT